jgi:hypothetical protein
MVDKIATPADLDRFLPRLRDLLQEKGLLLVLDNLETLLTPEGQWRDPRWAPLMDALISHDGESRVIRTSRTPPAGLDPNRVLVRSVHALSRDESVLLARELPHLRALLHSEPEPLRAPGSADPALGRRVLTLVQGHPKLLELADAAAADPARLASQLAAAEVAVDRAPLHWTPRSSCAPSPRGPPRLSRRCPPRPGCCCKPCAGSRRPTATRPLSTGPGLSCGGAWTSPAIPRPWPMRSRHWWPPR